MPFQSWGTYEINVLSSLCYDRRLTVILAHYERFAEFEKGNKLYEEVLELPVVIQINAASLCTGLRAGRWIRMFRTGQAHILGSDCHNLSSRAPDLDKGREVIRKKLGQETLTTIDRNASALLLGQKPKRIRT
jgi:protein-tyrosine phosphatase